MKPSHKTPLIFFSACLILGSIFVFTQSLKTLLAAEILIPNSYIPGDPRNNPVTLPSTKTDIEGYLSDRLDKLKAQAETIEKATSDLTQALARKDNDLGKYLEAYKKARSEYPSYINSGAASASVDPILEKKHLHFMQEYSGLCQNAESKLTKLAFENNTGRTPQNNVWVYCREYCKLVKADNAVCEKFLKDEEEFSKIHDLQNEIAGVINHVSELPEIYFSHWVSSGSGDYHQVDSKFEKECRVVKNRNSKDIKICLYAIDPKILDTLGKVIGSNSCKNADYKKDREDFWKSMAKYWQDEGGSPPLINVIYYPNDKYYLYKTNQFGSGGFAENNVVLNFEDGGKTPKAPLIVFYPDFSYNSDKDALCSTEKDYSYLINNVDRIFHENQHVSDLVFFSGYISSVLEGRARCRESLDSKTKRLKALKDKLSRSNIDFKEMVPFILTNNSSALNKDKKKDSELDSTDFYSSSLVVIEVLQANFESSHNCVFYQTKTSKDAVRPKDCDETAFKTLLAELSQSISKTKPEDREVIFYNILEQNFSISKETFLEGANNLLSGKVMPRF